MVPDAQFQRLQNRVAAAFLQRFQNTNLCSPGIGAAPQQAETRHFRGGGNTWFFAFVYTDALLATIISLAQNRWREIRLNFRRILETTIATLPHPCIL